jgi:hypothetical protein
MKKLRINLTVEELDNKTNYLDKERYIEKVKIDKEINLFEERITWIYNERLEEIKDENIYQVMSWLGELMQEDEDFVKKHGKSILICFRCAMVLNKEEEEGKFKENNQGFKGMCWECEEEQIRISEEIANEYAMQEEITENINEVNYQEIMEIEGNQEIDEEIERDITMTESEDEVEEIIKSERLQILIAELEKPRKNISEEVLTENGENLSLKQLYQKIRRRDQTLLEDYYYLGKKFKE